MTRFFVFVNNKDCLILVKTFALLYGIIKASIQKAPETNLYFHAHPQPRLLVATVFNMANLLRTEDPRLARPPPLPILLAGGTLTFGVSKFWSWRVQSDNVLPPLVVLRFSETWLNQSRTNCIKKVILTKKKKGWSNFIISGVAYLKGNAVVCL